ncbi:Flp pilus assembly protein TadB [Lipingzhangella halophila]|uniref:Flp pilus assembly protein TadB n=1 Tax=Lipingzhangella halophila TaxID=1783352 RepID=A0A7W7W4P9_9ACTN|nr:type II secretion system F family protein [Lipingzhangella halophila]MBB4934407.1 Flp pilus assembly protein TadB [Lipingzhangella halophila]
MTSMAISAVSGALVAGGLYLAVLTASAAASASSVVARTRSSLARLRRRDAVVRLGGALVAGLAVGVATGWPVAAVLAAAALWWLPPVLGPDVATRRATERIDAVATWTELLGDEISGAAGLHQAIAASAQAAPAAIREEVTDLDRRLREGEDAEVALAQFARRVGVPTADLVAVSLATGLSGHASDLGAYLARLAETARERSIMLARIAASRARLRSSVRIIVAVTVVMASGLVVFTPDFLTPYDSVAGQLVLALVGAIWAVSLSAMARMAHPDLGQRILTVEGGAT